MIANPTPNYLKGLSFPTPAQSQSTSHTVCYITVISITVNDLLASQLCTALMRIGTRMATGFDQYFSGLGLTQAQFRFLLAVWEEGGLEGIMPSSLAGHLLIERGTVSVLATALVKAGLIERRPGENRRSHRLALTAQGGALLQQSVPRAVTLADHTLAGLDAAHRLALRAALDTIEATLRDWTPPPKSQEEHS